MNTTTDYSLIANVRIAVMDDGLVVEFDTPRNLLAKQNGVFKELAEATGVANSLYLESLIALPHQ